MDKVKVEMKLSKTTCDMVKEIQKKLNFKNNAAVVAEAIHYYYLYNIIKIII